MRLNCIWSNPRLSYVTAPQVKRKIECSKVAKASSSVVTTGCNCNVVGSKFLNKKQLTMETKECAEVEGVVILVPFIQLQSYGFLH